MSLSNKSIYTTGLTVQEVSDSRKRFGTNELPSSKPRNIWQIAFSVIREPMFILLVSCGVIYLILGDIQGGVLLMGFVLVVMGITFYQERKTENALTELKNLSSPRALVIREGKESRIPGKDIVVGDIMVLKEGDRVPADAILISSLNLMADESLLSGESVPVRKGMGEEKEVNELYSSTLIVQGTGVAKVAKVGIGTRIGKIGQVMTAVKDEKTLLQKEMNLLIKRLTFGAIGLSIFLVVIYILFRGTLLNGLLAGLSLTMAMLPEEFPVVFTVFLALGAWRLSRKNVLTRNSTSIESLGAATVICADKTGTLTRNVMEVKCLFQDGKLVELDHSVDWLLPEEVHEVVEFGILASQTDPFDPMEKAILKLGHIKLAGTEHLHEDWEMMGEYPLAKELLAMSRVFRGISDGKYVVAAKGAPEAIFDLCHLSEEEEDGLMNVVRDMASKGLRVIGVANALFKQDAALPDIQHDFEFVFCGLIGLADPLRPEVKESVEQCYRAGTRVIMITGDYPETAMSIAREAGIKNPEKVITGKDLEELGEKELIERIKTTNIFARVVPEQKLKIVEILKDAGEVVAMTGDGVNDAPALKASHIGVAMGQKGTDVAREAADLVLLDDNFASIVTAIRLGRRIFDNLRKAFSYIMAVHVPIAGLAFLPVFIPELPLLLWPVHIAILELIIDPSSSVVFESEEEEPGIMDRPPHRKDKSIFGRKEIFDSLLNGIFVLAIVFGVYIFGIKAGLEEGQTRLLTFISLILSNFSLIFSGLSNKKSIFYNLFHPPKAAIWVGGGAAVLIGLIIALPWLRRLFQLESVAPVYLLVPLVAVFACVLILETRKMISKRV